MSSFQSVLANVFKLKGKPFCSLAENVLQIPESKFQKHESTNLNIQSIGMIVSSQSVGQKNPPPSSLVSLKIVPGAFVPVVWLVG